jgi:hypothetical protein
VSEAPESRGAGVSHGARVSRGADEPADRPTGKSGRKPAVQSRAAEICTKLLAWRQTRESQRISLRALAAEIGTSHQLLSFYLKRLDKWRAKQYERKAEEIRVRAEAENRPMTQGEEVQMDAYERASFHSMLDSLLAAALRQIQVEAKAGRLSKGQIKRVSLLAQRGYPMAQKILQEHSKRMNHQSRVKIGENNLPMIPPGAAKSFRPA